MGKKKNDSLSYSWKSLCQRWCVSTQSLFMIVSSITLGWLQAHIHSIFPLRTWEDFSLLGSFGDTLLCCFNRDWTSMRIILYPVVFTFILHIPCIALGPLLLTDLWWSILKGAGWSPADEWALAVFPMLWNTFWQVTFALWRVSTNVFPQYMIE